MKPTRSYDHRATARFRQALGTQDETVFKKALAEGADPNARSVATPFGKDYLLHEIARAGDPVALRLVLEAGARRLPGRYKATPLLTSAEALVDAPSPHRLDVYKQLLNSGDLVFRSGGEKETFALEVLVECMGNPHVDQAVWETLSRLRPHQWPVYATERVATTLVNRQSPEIFERFVSAGLPLEDTASMDIGLVGWLNYRLSNTEVSECDKTAWWDVMVALRDRLPKHNRFNGDTQGWAQLTAHHAEKLANQWEKPAAGRRSGPRL